MTIIDATINEIMQMPQFSRSRGTSWVEPSIDNHHSKIDNTYPDITVAAAKRVFIAARNKRPKDLNLVVRDTPANSDIATVSTTTPTVSPPNNRKYIIATGAGVFIGASTTSGIGYLAGMTSSQLLLMGCAGAAGVLLLALLIYCCINYRHGFFAPKSTPVASNAVDALVYSRI